LRNHMLKPIIFGLMSLITIALLTNACAKTAVESPKGTSPVSNTTQTISLRMGTGLPSTHPVELLNQKWIEKIQSETNGRVKITLYSGGTLIDDFQAWDELTSGVADIAGLTAGGPAGIFPLISALSVFAYGTDLKGARYVSDGLMKKFPELRTQTDGVKALYAYGAAESWIHAKKPIRTLADFKGMQIQPLPEWGNILEKLGATGSQVPYMEIYVSLDKGIVEGTFASLESLKSSNYAEITKYSTNLHVPVPPCRIMGMNQKVWESLPADIQKVFEDSIPWAEEQLDNILLQIDQEGKSYAEGKEHEFFDLSSEDLNTFNSYMNEIALAKSADLDAKGYPCTKIYQEARRLVEEYNSKK
jgi:TRAP-type transport system periplasmic protein